MHKHPSTEETEAQTSESKVNNTKKGQSWVQASTKKTILIIDDDESIRVTLKACLPEYTVIEAENGEEGISVLKKQVVDLVITDKDMPAMNGLEVIDWIRNHYVDVMIVLISGDRRTDEVAAVLVKQRVLYLAKPFELEKLLEVVDYCLNRKTLSILIEHPAAINVTLKMVEDMVEYGMSTYFRQLDLLFCRVTLP